MCLALALGVSSVQAAEVKVRGFASFMGGMTSSSDERYSGYDNHFSFSPESLAAVQFDANMGDGLTAAVQFVGKGVNEYAPTIEWAYMSYELTDSFRLNAGRLRMPFYRFSDSLDVRYTYPWVEAPDEVYGLPFSAADGLSLLYSGFIGDFETTVQAIFGQYDGKLSGPDSAQANIEDTTGLSWTVSNSWLYLRAAYIRSNVELELNDFDELIAGVNATASAANVDLSAVNSAILVDGDAGSFGGIAIGIDYNNILIDAEVIAYEIEEAMTPNGDAYFLSLGYRFNKITPYILLSKFEGTTKNEAKGYLPPSPAFAPLAQGLDFAFAAAENERESQEIGFRYDFHDLAAFKASYMMRDDQNTGEVDVIRAGVDLVF
jgi:hypothetical protein